jgi:hypothetical protein
METTKSNIHLLKKWIMKNKTCYRLKCLYGGDSDKDEMIAGKTEVKTERQDIRKIYIYIYM